MISPFDLVSISTNYPTCCLVMLSIFPMYIDHFYVFYEEMSMKAFEHVLKSVICLLLLRSCILAVAFIFWILALYSDTKFADNFFDSIGCLSIDF